VKEIEKNLLLLKPVKDVHDIHLWTLDGEYNVLTVHVVVDSDTPKSDYVVIKNQCRALLKETRIHHATIEIESESETCQMTTC
jgi:cobalt-zinc-cadmium efflux system protein